MKKQILIGLLLVYTLMGYSKSEPLSAYLTTPGTKKMENYLHRMASARYFSPYDTPGINNTAHASMITRSWMDQQNGWQPYQIEIPLYYPQSMLIKELIYSNYNSKIQEYVPNQKTGWMYDELERVTREERFYWNTDSESWMLNYIRELEYDHRDEIVYYAEYYNVSGEDEPQLMYGYKALDQHNDNGTLILRTWMYYYDNDWYPQYKEEYILNENDVVIEIYMYWYEEYKDLWIPEMKYLFTLSNEQEWVEAIIFFADEESAKPIYIVGSGTEAGWDNTAALEMTHLYEGEFAIFTTLGENGDMIKFLSRQGHWTPQWGYGGSGGEYYGTLSYRPSEEDPDPPVISISGLTPGEYIVYADTAYLFYEIFSLDDWKTFARQKNYSISKEEEVVWFPFIKLSDIEWHNFDKQLPEHIIVWMNPEGWFKNPEKFPPNVLMKNNDSGWIRVGKDIMAYNANDQMVLGESYYWEGDEENGTWTPDWMHEAHYDEQGNLTLETDQYWDAFNDHWEVNNGLKIEFNYHDNLSVNHYIVSFFENWSEEFIENTRYDYTYENLHNLNIGIYPANSGTTTGAGQYAYGATASLQATPAQGYVFASWTLNGVQLHTDTSYDYIMPDHDVTLMAVFSPITGTENPLSGSLTVHPNPATHQVMIQGAGNQGYTEAALYAADGRRISVHPSITGQSSMVLDVSDLKPGVYIIQLKTDHQVLSARIIKR